MQALEWAILYPDQVDAIVVIASTHAVQPQGVAWNAIARSAITADPDWQGFLGRATPLLVDMKSVILIPAPSSPMK